jgi:hypothetical protein
MVLSAAFIAAVVNFAVFWLVALYLGGDAVNGKAEGGRFFLGSHGRYTEVSEAVYMYSKWHVYVTWTTAAFGIVAAYWHQRIKRDSVA